MYHPWDMNIERGKCYFGGGTSTNTVTPSPMQDEQAAILKNLEPYITQYGKFSLMGMNNAQPGINQMLAQATGQNSPASAFSLMQGQNALKQTASQQGIRPGDPRMVSSMGKMGEASTKANLPEIQSIMSLYGMSPQNLIQGMGSGSPSGSTGQSNPSTGEAIAPYAGMAAMIAAALIIM